MAFQLARFSDAFDALRSLQHDFERGWWERSPFADRFGVSSGSVFPGVNIFEESADDLVLLAELPGVKREDINIGVQRDVISLEGERRCYSDDDRGRLPFFRRERGDGSFNRSFRLPFPIDPDRVEATMRDGVLTIRMVKAPEARARSIKISG